MTYNVFSGTLNPTHSLTVEDGGDFRSIFRTDIETFLNLWCVTTPYIEKKTVIYDRVWQPANDCRYLATDIGWRHVLGPILRNQHGPCRTASKHAPVCCPYCDRIATVLTKKHNMWSFFEDFRQKFSRTRFLVHTALWRPYNPAVLPGRAQRASHGSTKSHVLRPCYTAV